MFDIPYICKRLNRVLGEKLMKRFSPWGLVSEGEVYIKGRKQITFDVGGLTQLDYLDLYKVYLQGTRIIPLGLHIPGGTWSTKTRPL